MERRDHNTWCEWPCFKHDPTVFYSGWVSVSSFIFQEGERKCWLSYLTIKGVSSFLGWESVSSICFRMSSKSYSHRIPTHTPITLIIGHMPAPSVMPEHVIKAFFFLNVFPSHLYVLSVPIPINLLSLSYNTTSTIWDTWNQPPHLVCCSCCFTEQHNTFKCPWFARVAVIDRREKEYAVPPTRRAWPIWLPWLTRVCQMLFHCTPQEPRLFHF